MSSVRRVPRRASEHWAVKSASPCLISATTSHWSEGVGSVSGEAPPMLKLGSARERAKSKYVPSAKVCKNEKDVSGWDSLARRVGVLGRYPRAGHESSGWFSISSCIIPGQYPELGGEGLLAVLDLSGVDRVRSALFGSRVTRTVMAEVKLFGAWGSPFSRRVEKALKLKGVQYEYVEEDLANKSPLLLQYNPVHKKVPVLLHNGNPIAESLIIVEYIDDTWGNGPSILPKDPYDRAMARFWAKYIDEKCMPAIRKALLSVGEEGTKAKEEAEELLKFLDNELEGKKFFGGDSIGLADIAGNFIAYWYWVIAELQGIKLITKDKFPSLCKWMEGYVNSSFVKEHLPDREKLAGGLMARFRQTK
ncbi:hypothetical protein F511_17773 [Dorcoceras hygrometricum]|uniref:glutathione transferase n=1 Tax=Dorcoceras hygrometricum TaxID=472368 RepID=A0A2Z7ANA6_9LAMI|nr:hypothetical protein F511_17773 [Dorcoceras hygrometricum]